MTTTVQQLDTVRAHLAAGRTAELAPESAPAHMFLGNALRDLVRIDEALACFRASGNPYFLALALDCELRLGRPTDFFAYLEAHAAD